MLVTPGAHVTLLRGARVRLQVDAASSRISVIEGVVRLSCPAAELDLREGQTVRVDPANAARFWLDREVPAMDLDRWNEDRDKALAASSPAPTYPSATAWWIWTAPESGYRRTWARRKPKVAEGWAPFQNGRWRWYDAVGYTWVSDESWGWIPYHHGRWHAQGRPRLGLGTGRFARLQARRRLLALQLETRGMGSAGSSRRLAALGCPGAVPQRQYHLRQFPPRRAHHRSGGLQRSPEGAARRRDLRRGATFAGLPGIAPGSHASAAARGRHAAESRGPGTTFRTTAATPAMFLARAAADATGHSHQPRIGCAAECVCGTGPSPDRPDRPCR